MKQKEIIYTHDKYSVYADKLEIARSYVNSYNTGRVYDVKILQGMPRTQTIAKICKDCPDYAKDNDITPDYYPHLFSGRK